MKTGMYLFVSLLLNYVAHAQVEYTLDPAHTLIEFNAERFMIGEVTGKFKDFEGILILNSESKALEKVNINIITESLDTDHEVRDGHLRSNTWLDAETYPAISFKSEKIWQENDQWNISGELTIKEQSNNVKFPFEMQGPFKDPTGALTIGLSGDLKINRQDYGIKFSRIMDNGELFIGNDVNIRIRALAIAK
ncbi:MAG: YceI family protein [Bacteroidota bacterium]